MFGKKAWAVCDDRRHLMKAIAEMMNIPVEMRDVEGVDGYRCDCGDKAWLYIREISLADTPSR